MKNYEICEGIANTIKAIAAGDVYELDDRRVTLYNNSDAEEVQYMDEYGCIQTIGAEIWERDAEPVTVRDWIDNDVLEYEFIVGPDRSYRGARLCLVDNGPYVELDTTESEVTLYADGGARENVPVSGTYAIDEAMADLWACGC